MIRRRGVLAGLFLAVGPAIIRTPGLLMPIKPLIIPPAPDRSLLTRSFFGDRQGEVSDEFEWTVVPVPEDERGMLLFRVTLKGKAVAQFRHPMAGRLGVFA